jgi:hypothetical protein
MPLPTGFDAFKPISERNIFNTTRTRRRAGGTDENVPRVDTITLYGTFIYDKGPFAFFTGSGSEYQQVLAAGKSIAGYTVVEVTGTGVSLSSGPNIFELRVGMQLRRVEGGPWRVAGGDATPADILGSSATAADESSGSDESNIVKQMMKQREQELK